MPLSLPSNYHTGQKKVHYSKSTVRRNFGGYIPSILPRTECLFIDSMSSDLTTKGWVQYPKQMCGITGLNRDDYFSALGHLSVTLQDIPRPDKYLTATFRHSGRNHNYCPLDRNTHSILLHKELRYRLSLLCISANNLSIVKDNKPGLL